MSRGKPVLSEVRSFASLSSGLLARKGAARPAMRPQAFATVAPGLEDLGWNDMGDENAAPPPDAAAAEPEDDEREIAPVLEQRRVLEQTFATPAAPIEALSAAKDEDSAQLPASAAPRGRKSAFTLRLDGERHLRLRLACAVQHRSAQRIVTAALDTYLDSLPELDDFARQVPPTLAKRA